MSAGAYQGWWNDGRSAARRPARIRVHGDRLEIRLADEDRPEVVLDAARLFLTEEVYAGQPLRIGHPRLGAATLTVPDHGLAERLAPRAPGIRRRFLARHGTLRRFALWGGALAATVAALFAAVPLAAGAIAGTVPAEWAEGLGEAALRSLADGRRECRTPAGTAALDGLTGRLAAHASTEYRIDARVVAMPVVNAAAAPGGRIVVFSGLIERAESPDELAAVLAHEIGHAVERHPLTGVGRQMGHQLLISLLLGDAPATARLAADTGRFLLDNAYSREDEAAADRIGMRLLREAGIDSRGAAAFFRRLRDEHGSGLPAILATHPALDERIAAAERSAREGGPALSEEQWSLLRRICE